MKFIDNIFHFIENIWNFRHALWSYRSSNVTTALEFLVRHFDTIGDEETANFIDSVVHDDYLFRSQELYGIPYGSDDVVDGKIDKYTTAAIQHEANSIKSDEYRKLLCRITENFGTSL